MNEPTNEELASQMRAALDAYDLTAWSNDSEIFSKMYAVGLISGLEQCPHCNQQVTLMSKCTVKCGVYHVNLI